jgi:hypothetical protein
MLLVFPNRGLEINNAVGSLCYFRAMNKAMGSGRNDSDSLTGNLIRCWRGNEHRLDRILEVIVQHMIVIFTPSDISGSSNKLRARSESRTSHFRLSDAIAYLI